MSREQSQGLIQENDAEEWDAYNRRSGNYKSYQGNVY